MMCPRPAPPRPRWRASSRGYCVGELGTGVGAPEGCGVGVFTDSFLSNSWWSAWKRSLAAFSWAAWAL